MNKIIDKNCFCGKGLSGLANLGNTCFMNSAIQCISNTKQLTSYFIGNDFISDLVSEDKSGHHITKEWYRLLKGIWESNCSIAPKSFHRCIQWVCMKTDRDEFIGYDHKDVHSFIHFFLELLHQGLSNSVTMIVRGNPISEIDKKAIAGCKSWKKFFSKEYSIIIELFYGQHYSTIENKDGKIISEIFEPFSSIMVPIPITKENITLRDCLEKFSEKEELEEYKPDSDEKFYKKTFLWKSPLYLIICLKRYTNSNTKINNLIKFPINNLDLSIYCKEYCDDDSKYDLYGVCNHTGGTIGGHYFSFVKNMNDKWYCYNDLTVTEIPESSIITQHAYCLFYQKKNS